MNEKRAIDVDGSGIEYESAKEGEPGGGTLGEIEKLVDWTALVEIVKGLDRTKGGRGGRPLNLAQKLSAWALS